MSKSYRELAKQADEVTKVLRSKLKPNGIDGKSDTMLDQVAELKLNQANIEREARISELERFAGEHYGDTNPKGGTWCRDVNGKQFKPCVRCSANERIAELKAELERE